MNPFAALGYIYGFLGPPIEWGLNHLTQYFADIGVLSTIGAFGLAIIAVTLIIRGLLFPVFGWQLRTQRRIQAEQRRIAPQLQEVRKKYKKDPQKLNEEMMKLYREHGISPLSSLTGCLPLLFQLPIIYGLYSGIRNAAPTLHGQHVNFLWVHDLSTSPSQLGLGSHPEALIIPALAALATVIQSRMMTQPPRPDMSDQERQAYTLSKNMVFIAPVMVLVFGIQLYQGIALYWLTQNIFMICQQWYIVGWGGLKVPHWFPGAGRVTPLSFDAPPGIAYKPPPRTGKKGGGAAPTGSGSGRRRGPAEAEPPAEPAPSLAPLGRNGARRPPRPGPGRNPSGRPRMTQPTGGSRRQRRGR